MKILVAGAAGALGSRVSSRLIAAGHEVRGTTRGRPEALAAAGVRPVIVDLLDGAATGEAVASVAPDAIVQVLNALPPAGPSRAEDLQATNRIRIEGTRNLIAAAHATGVSRYVAESFIFGYGVRPQGAPPVTEDEPLATGLPPQMQPTIDALAEMERSVLAFGGVVLRCGLFYGHGVPSTDAMAARVRKRALPVFGFSGVVPWLHIDDAAAAVVAAVESERRGAIYNIAGGHAPFAEMVRALAASIGAPPPRRMPKVAARLAGSYLAAMLKSNLTVSTEKAARELGWAPAHPTPRDGLSVPAVR